QVNSLSFLRGNGIVPWRGGMPAQEPTKESSHGETDVSKPAGPQPSTPPSSGESVPLDGGSVHDSSSKYVPNDWFFPAEYEAIRKEMLQHIRQIRLVEFYAIVGPPTTFVW